MVLLSILNTITRLACIGFIIIVGMTIPEAWNLINETSYMMDGTTLYVPIETCKPLTIEISNNSTLSFMDNNSDSTITISDNCHTLEYFLNASVASMFFTAIGILLFILFDIISRYCTKGPITRSSIVGMSFFLAFMLIQTSASSYAIYQEIQRWIQFYEARIDKLPRITDVNTYADKFFFYLLSLFGVITAGLLLIDSIVSFCVGDTSNQSNNKKPKYESQPSDSAAAVLAPIGTNVLQDINSVDVENHSNNYNNNSITYEEEQVPNPKSWTTY